MNKIIFWSTLLWTTTMNINYWTIPCQKIHEVCPNVSALRYYHSNQHEYEYLTFSPLSCQSGLYSLNCKYGACPQKPESNYTALIFTNMLLSFTTNSPIWKMHKTGTQLVCLHTRTPSIQALRMWSRIPPSQLPTILQIHASTSTPWCYMYTPLKIMVTSTVLTVRWCVN